MSKFFKQEETKKLKLSEYLELDETEFKYFLCEEKYRGPRTKYIMEIIGDAEMDEATYKLFLAEFQRYGGRYDVRTKRETIKGIYDISQKYPTLTASALEEIWSVYIRDQFEEYDVRFTEDAKSLDKYKEEYGEQLIKHLQYIVKSQHISASEIEKALPSKELIDKDRQQLIDISTQTRIFFGACHPISYQMIESLATGQGLDDYPEQPAYLINGTRTIDTTFTKQEFLDSIQKRLASTDAPKQKQKK